LSYRLLEFANAIFLILVIPDVLAILFQIYMMRVDMHMEESRIPFQPWNLQLCDALKGGAHAKFNIAMILILCLALLFSLLLSSKQVRVFVSWRKDPVRASIV